jgi:biotin carboxylase
MTAAMAAEALGLRFHPAAAVDACRNKWMARKRFHAAGLRVPSYRRVPSDSDPVQLATEPPYPCVLKPLGLSGSRGVIRADNREEFVEAFERIGALLEAADIQIMEDESSGWVQIESYIPGREFALEGLVTNGDLKTLALFDKPDPLEGPYFEETIYVTPSRERPEVQQAIRETTQKAITALGLANGPIHAEMRVNLEGVWMLEVAARPIGGLCAEALRFGEGMPLEELIVRHALGEDVSGVEREQRASGVMMIPIPRAGFYEGVEGIEKALQAPGVESVEISAKLRQKLVPLPEGSSYLGFIFARGDTPKFVERALREAHAQLRFEISALLPMV